MGFPGVSALNRLEAGKYFCARKNLTVMIRDGRGSEFRCEPKYGGNSPCI